MKISTDTARNIAFQLMAAGDANAEMARFATKGQADGYALLKAIEYSAEQTANSNHYTDAEHANITTWLDYLRAWVHEYHGRYAVGVYTTEYGDWKTDDQGDTIGDERPKVGESAQTILFRTYQEIVDYMQDKGSVKPTSFPGPFTLNTWAAAMYEKPCFGAEETTFHAEHGLTARGWNAILRAAMTR